MSTWLFTICYYNLLLIFIYINTGTSKCYTCTSLANKCYFQGRLIFISIKIKQYLTCLVYCIGPKIKYCLFPRQTRKNGPIQNILLPKPNKYFFCFVQIYLGQKCIKCFVRIAYRKPLSVYEDVSVFGKKIGWRRRYLHGYSH